jgi:hypothetical protein
MTGLPAAGGVDGVPSSGGRRAKQRQVLRIHMAWSRERVAAFAPDMMRPVMNASLFLHPSMIRST